MKLFWIVLFQFSILYSQTKIDSLMKTMKDLPDTAKIERLGEMCLQNRYKDQLQALLYGEKAVELSRTLGNRQIEAKMLGIVGVSYRILGNYEKSLNSFFDALNIAEECQDSTTLAYAENNIGTNYLIKSYYNVALKHIRNGLIIFRSLNDKAGMAYCTKSLGDIYLKQQNYSRALANYDSTYMLRKEIGYTKGLYTATSKIADVYVSMKKYDIALKKYSEAETGFYETGDLGAVATTKEKIAQIYIDIKNYKKALTYTLQGYNIGKELKISTSIINCGKNLGIIYAKLGRYNEAENILNASLILARQNKDDLSIIECFSAYSTLYKEKNDLKSALQYTQLVSDMKDSITSKESVAGAGEMEAVYENQKDIREKKLFEKNIQLVERQKNYLIIIIILMFFVSFVFYRLYRFKKRTTQELRDLNATKDKFFSIIAHDLKSPFQGFLGLTEIMVEQWKDLSSEEISKFVNLMHKSANNLFKLLTNLLEWAQMQGGALIFSPTRILLNKLITENIEAINTRANQKEIKIINNIKDDFFVFADMKMINSVLVNLISNAVKFTKRGGTIQLYAKESGNKLIEVCINDNGVGIREDDLKKLFKVDEKIGYRGTDGEESTGLGLLLCKEFITKNGGSLRINSQFGKGSDFYFTVPKNFD